MDMKKQTQMEMYIVPLDPMGCSFLPCPGVKCNTFKQIDLNDFSRKEKRILDKFILLMEYVIIRDIKFKQVLFSMKGSTWGTEVWKMPHLTPVSPHRG